MAPRSNTWMPFYWGDYLRDTGHLSAAEHGAYILLLGHYWTTGKPLPDNDELLARIARTERGKWDEIKAVISGFFEKRDGSWHHKRVSAELRKSKKITKARSYAGKASAASRQQKPSKGSTKFQQKAKPRARAPSPSPSPSQSQPPSPSHPQSARAGNSDDSQLTDIPEHMIRMAKVPKLDDLTVTEPLREWAKQEAPDVNLDGALGEFRDYCLAKDPKYKDYMAAFRNSLRRTEARAQGRNGGAPSLMETIDRIGAEDGE